MASAGRKGKYDTHVKPYLSEIQKWCNSLTEEQICKRLGVGKTAWNEYKKTHSELAEAIKNGRSDLVSDLRSALIQKDKGYDYTETKVTTERLKMPKVMRATLIEAGFREEDLDKVTVVKQEEAVKHASPDVAAINLALKNYDPENWANDPQMLQIRKKELELRERQVEANEW